MEMPLFPLFYLFALAAGFFMVAAVVNVIKGIMEKGRKLLVMAARCVLLIFGLAFALMIVMMMFKITR